MNASRPPLEILDAGAALVRRRAGLQFSGGRRAAFDTALAASMHRTRAATAAAYLAMLEVDPVVLDDLMADITTGETYFFRNPQQLEMIRRSILPSWIAGPPRSRPFRVWSAGCASGEEAYTLAILLHEEGLPEPAHIIGTDLSRAALAAACRASFTQWSLRGVPADIVRRYFTQDGNRFVLASSIREAVELRYLNLAEPSYPSLSSGIWGMDLILCRNVMIYLDAETIAGVARRLLDSLSDTGWLLLGASDPVLSTIVPCEVTVTEAGLAYRRPAAGASRTNVATYFHPLAEDLSPPELPILTVPIVDVPVRAPTTSTEPFLASEPPDDRADADSYYAAGDYERAAAIASRLLRRDGCNAALWIVLVRALANRGKLSAADEACAAALVQHRMSAELTYLHAVLLSEASQYAAAVAAARRALYLDGALIVAHLVLGGALAHLRDRDGARLAFHNAQRLLAMMPASAVVPAADGELAGHLSEMARIRLRLLDGSAA